MEAIIDEFALRVISHVEEVGSESVGAVGRTKMDDGRYIAWNIDVGFEDDGKPPDNSDDEDDDIALVATFPKRASRRLN